jgi:peroxiredoxin
MHLTAGGPQQQIVQAALTGLGRGPGGTEIRQPPRGDFVESHRTIVRPPGRPPLTGMTLLNPGDPFPALRLTTTAGELTLPDHLAGDFGVVLVNRGAWCPYCVAQLSAFSRAQDKLPHVVALWTEDEATTREFVDKRKITFPVAYGVNAAAVAEATGAFVNPDPVYLQSTGFVLGPDGKVLVSVYSSGAIGRLVPDDVSGMIDYVKSVR